MAALHRAHETADEIGIDQSRLAVGGDPLRDEDIDYAQRLAHADIPTELALQRNPPCTPPLRQALHEHAATPLAEPDIDEPVTWSPPADLADGLDLPGVDTDTLDMTTISRLVVEEYGPLGEAARTLGVHIEHVRLALERLDRPQRQWAANAAPTSWLTEQRAARLFTREFFDREYLHKGRGLNELAEATRIGRHIIARIAEQLSVPLNKGRAPFPIDPNWLREQHCDRLRPTADITAELGTDQLTVNNAPHRLGIPARPAGIASHPHVITKLERTFPATFAPQSKEPCTAGIACTAARSPWPVDDRSPARPPDSAHARHRRPHRSRASLHQAATLTLATETL